MESKMKVVTMWYDHVGLAGKAFRDRVDGLIKAGTLRAAGYTPERSNNVWFGRVQVKGDPDVCQVIEGVQMMVWRDIV